MNLNKPARLGAAFAAVWLACLGCTHAGRPGDVTQIFEGRDMIVHAPATLPPAGKRALVIVLHGGLGNAHRIAEGSSESALNLDRIADQDHFVVAYLSGTRATRILGSDKLAWNAGDCCGQPAANDVDDVGYITKAVAALKQQYAIDPARIYGIGHSNGALMSARMICESNLYAAAIVVSGPLGVEACPNGKGKRVLSIHGANDANVPISGGRGTKGYSGATFESETHAHEIYAASGVAYELDLVAGADHALANIETVIEQTEHRTLGEKAVAFFGIGN